ncbi:MAG: sigma-70 family RNA polymerase sigma factor [Bacteroidales bacterium]|nr:sigma-70 family RNA polymerase sigma factor [Bacteroidales bacterium]
MKKNKYNDEEIIEGLRQGNDNVLNFLYKNYYGVVRNMVLKSSGNEDQARDIFQEVIIVIYNKLQDSKFKITSSFFTFFYAVIKITWLNYRKLNMKNPLGYAKDYNDEIGSQVAADDIEILAAQAIRNNLFTTYFKQMTEGCQKILKFYLAEYKAEDIALELGLKSANYVRKRKSECLKLLIEKIRKDALYKELK